MTFYFLYYHHNCFFISCSLLKLKTAERQIHSTGNKWKDFHQLPYVIIFSTFWICAGVRMQVCWQECTLSPDPLVVCWVPHWAGHLTSVAPCPPCQRRSHAGQGVTKALKVKHLSVACGLSEPPRPKGRVYWRINCLLDHVSTVKRTSDQGL